MTDLDAALRSLPSHGWKTGWTGRRDRALLVLSQMAGLPYQSIAELTVEDISVTDGVAVIRTPGGTTTLRRADDVVVCGPCALARWIHALDLTTLYPSGQVAAAIIARAAPLRSGSPHLCTGRLEVAAATRRMPVLPTTDAWGPHTVIDVRTTTMASTDTGRSTARKITVDIARPAEVETAAGAPSLPAQGIGAVPKQRNPLTARMSRYPAGGTPASNCDPSRNLETRARQLLGHVPQQSG